MGRKEGEEAMSPERVPCLGPETNLRQLFSMIYRGLVDVEKLVDVMRRLKSRDIAVREALEETS